MTAIAGVVEDGTVWIGGDSAGVSGLAMQTRSDPKVFVNGEFLFGYTSSFRMGQLLRYEFCPPSRHEGDDDMGFMVKRFIPAVKSCFEAGGFGQNKNDGDWGGVFLVGYRGSLYEVQADYQVGKVNQPYHAAGCGEDLVLGSLHATDEFELEPSERILMALGAAEEFSAGVRSPFLVLSI